MDWLANSMGSQRVGHDEVTNTLVFIRILSIVGPVVFPKPKTVLSSWSDSKSLY